MMCIVYMDGAISDTLVCMCHAYILLGAKVDCRTPPPGVQCLLNDNDDV